MQQQGNNVIIIHEIKQQDWQAEISQRQIPFDNHEQQFGETEEEIHYQVQISKYKKQTKTVCQQKYCKRILFLVVSILTLITILLTLFLSSPTPIGTIVAPTAPKTQSDVNPQPISNKQILPLITSEQIPILNGTVSPQIQQNLQKTQTIQQSLQPPTPNINQTSPLQPQNITGPKQLKQVYIPIQNPDIKWNFYQHPITQQHIHQKTPLNYSSMGIPQIGTTFNFTQVKYQDLYHYQSIMDNVFKPYNDTNCDLQRYGDNADGGYLLCKNLMNSSVALINLGVQGRDQFGCQLTSAFPMANYQYDCTNALHPDCPTNNHSNFYSSSCLGERTQKSQNTQFFSLKDIVDSRNLTKKHVTMKIDIEGGQWPAFRTFPIEYLDYVDQFILEIHNPGRGIQQGALWGNADIIKSLGQKFISVNLHMNNYACIDGSLVKSKNRKIPSFAIEVTMVNKARIKLNSNSRSYALNSKNHPNAPSPDCQMSD